MAKNVAKPPARIQLKARGKQGKQGKQGKYFFYIIYK